LIAGSHTFDAVATDTAGNQNEPFALATVNVITTPVNLVQNGNFDQGFGGWTKSGNPDCVAGPYGPGSTTAAVFYGGSYNSDLTQTITTVAGHHYTLSFDLSSDGGVTNDLKVQWGGPPSST
jgi:hypothetical protein